MRSQARRPAGLFVVGIGQHSVIPGQRPLVFLIAGEPSGDLLGARLMAAMKRKATGRVCFAGIGGERMIAEGLESLFPLHDLSLMGIAELLPRLPNLILRGCSRRRRRSGAGGRTWS